MSGHIQVVKDALEFNGPAYLPMEIVDVPGIYNAYHTLDPDAVEWIAGTEDFDMLWPNCYSWLFTQTGRSGAGEPIKEDQFGNVIKVPHDEGSSYVILKNGLMGWESIDAYEFPDPSDTDQHFAQLGAVIRQRYADRFVNAYIDAGIFLTTLLLWGEERLLMALADDPKAVAEVYRRAAEYYKALVLKFKQAGAHMITVIEDVGSTASLLMAPACWREHFRPVLADFFRFVHEQNMYTGILIDGNSAPIHDDLLEIGLDLYCTVDIDTTGLETVRQNLKGKVCIKACVDMQTTLAQGTPEQVEQEAHKLIEHLNTPEGGFICQVVRWHRPTYAAENVAASVHAFNQYRDIPVG